MPGRGEAGEYGEVTSTSDCTDYQARRLNIRYKPAGQKGTRFVHTLNGTAVALSRALIVVLENYQRADGLVDVPEVLRPYLGQGRDRRESIRLIGGCSIELGRARSRLRSCRPGCLSPAWPATIHPTTTEIAADPLERDPCPLGRIALPGSRSSAPARRVRSVRPIDRTGRTARIDEIR